MSDYENKTQRWGKCFFSSVFSKHGRLYLLSGIQSDVVLMENQLPLFLLRKLINVAYGQGFLVRIRELK